MCKTHRESTPLRPESEEEMMNKFGEIVGKVLDAVKARDWGHVVGWEGVMQCWNMLQYPLPRALRAKLASLFYALLTTPGIEGRIVHSFATALYNLIENKKRIAIEDWQPDWRPLWELIQREYKLDRKADSTRNLASIFLHACGSINRFIPASEIPVLLETFLPKLNLTTYLLYLPPLLALLPHSSPEQYLPPLLTIWEALNSSIVDERMLSFMGALAVRHVEPDERGEGADWEKIRDGKEGVGMWQEPTWRRIMGKCLRALNVPLAGSPGSSTTALHADLASSTKAQRLHRAGTPIQSLCKIIVYSMAPDGPVKGASSTSGTSGAGTPNGIIANGMPASLGAGAANKGYLGGSKALESLDRLITSTESFFHPSNAGIWTVDLTSFIHRITYEFLKRVKEEERSHCRIPAERRITPLMRLSLVRSLKTVALLAMFSKDPVSVLNSQLALRNMALLEPNEIMPEIVERAYEGLEVINETHRTTAVMSATAAVAGPLVNEKLWKDAGKHVAPLLELCLPGIDLNDPGKTMCSTLVVVAMCQQLYISDLSLIDLDDVEISDEERTLKNNTAAFPEWVTMYVERVFILIENLPEEGGRGNRTGGKSEDNVLKSVQSSLDVLFSHLAPNLFDLVLDMIYSYASTTVRSNGVRAVGNLVLSLAKANPGKTLKRFWPFCRDRIREELENGASSIRSTSSGTGVPGDTALHWNLSILRSAFHFSCPELLSYKDEIIDLLALLIEKTKSERGYTYSARIITKLMGAMTTVYPKEYNLVNPDELESEDFQNRHNKYWGKMYLAEEVKIAWHVPSVEETAFVIDVLERLIKPFMEKLDALLAEDATRDSVWRNDFVRFTSTVRATWAGLGSLFQEEPKQGGLDLMDPKVELAHFTYDSPRPQDCFVLTDPKDPRYQKVVALRASWGELLHRASVSLLKSGSEDFTDVVTQIVRAIDGYMTEYAVQRSSYDSDHKRYNASRELTRFWPRQKAFPRHIWVRRAYLHVLARKYQHSLYRRRSELDDRLIAVVVEFSLSPYTRVRKSGQAVLFAISTTYTRSTRFALPKVFEALAPGTDPDRMKGALHVTLWSWLLIMLSFGIDWRFQQRYMLAVLESSWQEKPSIQQLISSIVAEILGVLQEELSTTVMRNPKTALPIVDEAASQVRAMSLIVPADDALGNAIEACALESLKRKEDSYTQLVDKVLAVANAPTTHWRYTQMAIRFLRSLLRRDRASNPDVTRLFARSVASDNPTTRRYSQQALEKVFEMIKLRSMAQDVWQLLMESGRNPLKIKAPFPAPDIFWEKETFSSPFYDKLQTGALIRTPLVDAYKSPPVDTSAFQWEVESRPALDSIRDAMDDAWFSKLVSLYSQESSGSGKDARHDNVRFIMRIFKLLEDEPLERVITVVEPLLDDKDRFKQRAAAEVLAGLLRGSKNWPRKSSERLWSWISPRLPGIFDRITPDTLNYWEYFLTIILSDRDPRRSTGTDFVIDRGLSVDFAGESAFRISNAVAAVGIVAAAYNTKFEPWTTKFLDLAWNNLGSGFAEVRTQVAANIDIFVNIQWHPAYNDVEAFVDACRKSGVEALSLVNLDHMKRVENLAAILPKLKETRLSGPKVNQSEYDKVGLSALKWIWLRAHSCVAPSIYPYMQPLMQEALRMSELMDSSDLRSYAIGLLYILSAVTPSVRYVEPVMHALIEAVRTSPSWRVRLQVLPIMQVFYFRQLPLLSDECSVRVLDVLVECLEDEAIEVREMAAKTLSGVIRCSQRHSILELKARFVRKVHHIRLPPRTDATYNAALRSLHAGVLGLTALIDAYPYTVPSWVPSLLPILAEHSYEKPPISTTVRKCAADFRRTHQDTWHTDKNMFDEEQTQALQTIISGTSYCKAPHTMTVAYVLNIIQMRNTTSTCTAISIFTISLALLHAIHTTALYT
ncbi:ARM repeat-containing protein [Calocera viscosa TUFC12733]|uniref:ARM repeat-containing protein n=1 Tax=Calocera viscosa (strain TUFC12733) TaxID=1330018 RepID=A0A167RI74_CALVF|nr:ARM repeat-containing protein [Calocera viscosa TUFC12733]